MNKYTAKCDHCKKETTIGYEEWLSLTKVMLTFSDLTEAQKDIALLLVDGMKFRSLKNNAESERIAEGGK